MARPNKISIHQFHSGSAVADAVTNSMFFVQSILQSFGFESDIFVEHLDPALAGRLHHFKDLRAEKDDLLLIHHSMGHDAFTWLASLRCRKFLVYHNITPPRFFEERDPAYAYALNGYSQLSLFQGIVESAIAVSAFNARQLSQRGFDDVPVIPLLKDFAAVRYGPHSKAPYYDGSATFRLLFVGRIIPHKAQHKLIEFVEAVRSIGSVPLSLVLVGHVDETNVYPSYLNHLVSRAALVQQVKITGRVTDEDLFGWYRAASAYVSLSEHEGFGVPLVEAMAFDLPVIAYASSAVSETLGDAGITISDQSPASILEPLIRLHNDRSFKREVIRSQRNRLLRFSRSRIETDLRRWLVAAGAFDGDGEGFRSELQIDEGSSPPGRTHYVIEGPFETSYSLAVVNRNLALALDQRPACASYIEPADGTEDYRADRTAAAKLPAKIQDLLRPAPVGTEQIVAIRNTYPPRPNGMLGDLRLLHLAWEESALPDHLAALINLHLDGALVPSEYVKRVVRNSGVRLPIAVIGHGIDHFGRPPREIGDRVKRGPATPSLPFTFLHISSGLARKGIDELITAYCIAFSQSDPVLLVIKTFDNPTNTVDTLMARMTSMFQNSPAIQVISEELDQRQMEFLYQIGDALVLPTRGEGFNLPAAEGMACGLPVIVTRHSGHLDFCNDTNSFLIDCNYELSTSHMNLRNSFWARASVEQLVQMMKTVYRAGRPAAGIVASRSFQGRQDAHRLQWHEVAERVDRFAEYLGKRPVVMRKLRLGWISTYNARCGIATHSEHLLEYFDKETFDITILADDQQAIGPDPDNMLRLWSKGRGGLARIRDYLVNNHFDTAFFQHNFSFFDFADFANILIELADANIDTFVTFHRTRDLESERLVPRHRMRAALQCCTRIFVHSLEDVERLRECGVTENVILLAHGVIGRPALKADAVRGLLGLSEFTPVIGTFGFLLPGKGLPELLHSFALMLKAHPAAYLLMLNADYPTPKAQEEREHCLALVRLLELERHLTLINEFLNLEELLFLLNACDAIVFPYQQSEESASGAVRLGLASGRPVLTTPLPIFSDLSDVVCTLPGTDARDIAEGVLSLLQDEGRRSALLQRQREWVRTNSWAAQSARLSNIIQGSFEEKHGVELRAPSESGSGLSSSTKVDGRTRCNSSLPHEGTLAIAQKLFGRSAASPGNGAPAAQVSAEVVTLPQPVTPPGPGLRAAGNGSGFLGRLGSKSVRLGSGDGRAFLTRADRARDARDWTSAARYYRKALDQMADDAAIWVQYGHALKESGNLSAAEEAYRKSLALDPNTADTHLQLGHALKIQGKRIEASMAYFRALVLDPTLEDASFELRGLGWTRGRIQLALRREQTPSL